MASANALAPLRWKRAKIHRGSRRRRRSLTPHKEAGYTSAVVTLGPELPNPLAIGRGPYTSRHDNALGPIVLAQALLVTSRQTQLRPRRVVRAQLVCHQNVGRESLFLEQ